MKTAALVFFSILSVVSPLPAQLVVDGASVTLANVTTNITGTITVGTNGSFTLLTLSDNALLTNSLNGVIGLNITAKSNEVRLVSPTARWQMGSLLLVGSNSAFNRLVITNGGRVTDTEGYVGFNTSGSNNEAVVTGTGSTWSNRTSLVVGELGANNRMEISDGGWVTGDFGTIGKSASAANNRVLVTGNNSTWSNRFTLQVGLAGSGNELVVSNGAQVLNDDARIGNVGLANRVTVTGAGSHWSNTSALDIGLSGVANRLSVESGGRVSSGIASLGVNAGSLANEASVSGAGSSWNNQGDLLVGLGTAFNSLIVSNGGWVGNGDGYVGYGGTANNNTAFVTGAGSLWSNANLQIGRAGRNSQLIVSNGATVLANVDSFLGHEPGSSNNLAAVTGASSLWTNGFDFYAGYQEGRNQLLVNNGGVVADRIGQLGYFSIANNNAAVVSGPGSVWSHRLNLNVGLDGAGNSLVVSNGGLVTASNGITVGVNGSSLNNRVVVNGGTLRAANAAGTGVLDVRRGTNVLNAGLVEVDLLRLTNALGKFEFNGGTLITRAALVTNGAFTVGSASGAPAIWGLSGGTNFLSSGLFIGTNSSFNQMFITNGAVLTNSGAACVGWTVGYSNTVTVSGSGSKWQVDSPFSLKVGDRGDFNRLVVESGARVECDSLFLGNANGGSNNSVLVTGSNSVLSIPGLNVEKGTITVSNGGSMVGVFLDVSSGNVTVNGGYASIGNSLSLSPGIFTLNAGVVEADYLNNSSQNSQSGRFILNGGTFRLASTHISSIYGGGIPFIVGDGTNNAVLELQGRFYVFSNGITVLHNGILSGSGTNLGNSVFIAAGGTLAPGTPIGTIGRLGFAQTPSLSGTIQMDISKTGTVRTNDEITSPSMLYAGSLIVSNLGPTPLAAGDKFRLFTASSYMSSFTGIALPPLNDGLVWTNKLLVDGSLEVVSVTQPGFGSISREGTNIVFAGTNGTPGANYTVLAATNVALPASNWISIATKQFDANGAFSFTNAIVPGIPQRFFRLRVP